LSIGLNYYVYWNPFEARNIGKCAALSASTVHFSALAFMFWQNPLYQFIQTEPASSLR